MFEGARKYLTFPMEQGEKRRSILVGITEMIRSKLNSWKQNLLSHAGKVILLNDVISAIPTYMMSCCKLQNGWCDEINFLMA